MKTHRKPSPSDAHGQTQDNAVPKDTHDNGIPKGLPATETPETKALGEKINRYLVSNGKWGLLFKAQAIPAAQLPGGLRRAISGFQRATGATTVIFRSLTLKVFDFNGVSFKGGTVYINETSQNPITHTVSHEFMHEMSRSHLELYQ